MKPIGIRKQYLFLPPFDYRHLSEKRKNESRWLKKTFHGFSWNWGLKDYEESYLILNELDKRRCVYVKGLDKKKCLEKLLSYVKIIDIDVLKCPSLTVLKQQSSFLDDCPYDHNSKNCASNNVYHMTNWILNFWKSTCEDHCKVPRLDCSNCINLLF